MSNSEDSVRVEVVDIAAIEEDDKNPNAGTPRGAALLDFSFDEYGPVRGIALDRKNRTTAGNKTLKAARRAGIKKVVVVETDGDVLVATRRRDMDLDEPRTREYTFMDNRANEVGLAWDADQTARAVEEGADLGIMFYDDELARIYGEEKGEADEDAAGDDEDHDFVPEMELQPFEHYDYAVLFFRNSMDWTRALDVLGRLGLVRQGFSVSKGTRKIGLCRVIDGARLLEVLGEQGG
jgi:hypothetical protein